MLVVSLRCRVPSAYGAVALLLISAAFIACAVVAQPARASVARGVADPMLTQPGVRMAPAAQSEALAQIGTAQLKARWVRFVVSWSLAEPELGTYDEGYMTGVDNAVMLARENGLKVMVTFSHVPEWASNSYYWTHNPYKNMKRFDPRFAMKTDSSTLAAFREFCAYMGERYKGQVAAYECWNEPNLHLTLYPQATPADSLYGAHVYAKMLKQFSLGIRAADPDAIRIAGATAPRGYTSKHSLSSRQKMTSPQRFARAIRAAGLGKYYDAYSHHPYVPGATAKNWPEAAPPHPEMIVTLGNLSTLLKLFPNKPFYLTEYGYQTAPCNSFSQQYVSLAKQAGYLRRAYSYVKRYRQVKALMWFLLDDYSPSGNQDDPQGFYTGLRSVNLAKKPSWYAFAGGNHLTLYAPTSVISGRSTRLYGRLRSDAVGPVAGRSLHLQARRRGSSTWSTLEKAKSDSTGRYAFFVRPFRGTYYRVRWAGVVASRTRFVALR